MPRFVPRERKHKRLEKQKKQQQQHSLTTAPSAADANTEIIFPVSSEEKEGRRQQLRDELRAQQSQEKISSKKRKRLDHYIDTKLRREENADLIRKLAQQKISTDLLQSSKKLGRVRESKREILEQALAQRNAGIDVRGDQAEVLYRKRRAQSESGSDEDEDDGDIGDGGHSKKSRPESVSQRITPLQATVTSSNGLFGSGLKKSLDSKENETPLITRRKRRKRQNESHNFQQDGAKHNGASQYHLGNHRAHSTDQESDSAWDGFDTDVDHNNYATSDSLSDDTKPGNVTNGKLQPPSSDSGSTIDSGGSEEAEEGDSVSSQDSTSDSDTNTSVPARASAFKQWAEAQRHAVLGFVPSTAPTMDKSINIAFTPRLLSPDPMATNNSEHSVQVHSRPEASITIARSDDIQKARMELPIVQEEQRIMEAIHNHPTVIVCGATGSGKTTQVPQMMFESGYGSHCGTSSTTGDSAKSPHSRGLIGVTQPRRVAAVSVAERVAAELGEEYADRVGHQVRYDTSVSNKTAIKFMTDGILLREISQDFILSKYSAIVIDEAHERSVNTDILIGMLSRIVSLRHDLSQEKAEEYYPLKLVIMSATLRVEDFTQNDRLFRQGVPPIVQAEGRQFPVTIHFGRRTQQDYVSETASKLARGHRKLPQGAMLVFLTGQNEIQAVAKRLKDTIGNTAGVFGAAKVRESADQLPLEIDDFEAGPQRSTGDVLEGEESEQSDTEIQGLDAEEDDDEFEVDDVASQDAEPLPPTARVPLKAYILPLYASLPTTQQMRVFKPPPPGTRLIILATNVAETSLTIPGIRYVFDCGRGKEKRYNHDTGVQTFEVDWISKASAAQRTGRAGRTGPGHCWRLYSSAVFEEFFPDYTIPEILRTPIEGTVLQLKAMNVENVVNFPFPTSPEPSQIESAERLLRNLGAIDHSGTISPVGKELMKYPISPRFGKMLLVGIRNGILTHVIAIVAALAVGEILLPELRPDATEGTSGQGSSDDEIIVGRTSTANMDTAATQRHQSYTRAQGLLSRWDDRSDVLKLLTAVAAFADAAKNGSQLHAARLAQELYLREKGMVEVQQLRQQLQSIARTQSRVSVPASLQVELPLANEQQRKMISQVVAAGYLDQIAIRADLVTNAAPTMGRKPKRAIEVPYRPLFPFKHVDRTAEQEAQELQKSVFVHSSSVLSRLSVSEMPGYVIYSHLSQSAPKLIANGSPTPRTRMHPLTTIGPKALAALAEGTPLLQIGKPIGKVEERDAGKRRICWASVALRPPAGEAGEMAVEWPLGAWKVEQVRRKSGRWEIDKVMAR